MKKIEYRYMQKLNFWYAILKKTFAFNEKHAIRVPFLEKLAAKEMLKVIRKMHRREIWREAIEGALNDHSSDPVIEEIREFIMN